MLYSGLSLRNAPKTYSRLTSLLAAGLLVLVVFIFNNWFRSIITQASGPPPCVTVSAAGPVWQNLAFVAPQSGTFTAEVDATPLGNGIDGGIGLSNGSQTTFAGLACIARFNTSGAIDARNG